MGLFEFGRSEGYPARYSEFKTPVTFDVLEVILIAVFLIFAVALVTIIPGYSRKRSIYVSIKVFCSLLIGCFLILENFGQEWEIGYANTTAPYRAGEKSQIKSIIGLKIGLRSMNITLQGEGEPGTPLAKEMINYNERFWWTWDQGRFGFGPYAGLLQRSFREAQRKGLPIPILWVAEYFVIDGEGIRFGRFYRTAGWYSHILLWTAFACWILVNIFLQSVGRYAAYFLGVIGGLQFLACVIWVFVRNPYPLIIPFEDDVIILHLGVHFWMSFTCGMFCIVLATIMIFMDLRFPNTLSLFLGIDPLDQYDECLLRSDEFDGIIRKKAKPDDYVELGPTGSSPSSKNSGMIVLKRRSTIRNVQKALFRAPVPMQIDDLDNETAVYENQNFTSPVKSNVQVTTEGGRVDSKPPVPKRVKKVYAT